MFSIVQNTTWTYHAKVWTNITATAGPHPPPAIYASLTTDSTDAQLVYTGGELTTGANPWNHYTWAFKNGQWNNISASAPFNFGRIILAQTTDDPLDHGLLAIGIAEYRNVTPFVLFPATFVFSGGFWTNLTPTLSVEPRIPYLGALAYVAAIPAVVFQQCGGVNSTNGVTLSTTTWEYTHASGWRNVTSPTGSQPDNGIVAGNAYDPVDGTWLLFGGERFYNPLLNPATWIFSAPPNVSATASKTTLDAGQSVSLTGIVSGGISPETVHWNLGDGGSSSSLALSHPYTRTGLITATLSETDFLGRSASSSVSFYVNPALALSINATPASPAAGSTVSLTSALSGGTAPYSYAWSPGDNSTTSSAASLGHAYASAGTYHVKLTVIDAAGSSISANLTLIVQSAPSAGVSLTSGTGLGLLAIIIVLLIVAAVLAVLLMRRPKGPEPMPAYAGSPTPPPAMGPPPPAPPPPPPQGPSTNR